MRVAIIDLGTNSVRFDVHQLGPGDQVKELHREKLMVRLGQGVFTEGKLDRNAIRRTLQAFSSFKETASRLHAKRIVAFGTSALREAKDSQSFLALIKKRTGIDIRVISGEEEARLIAGGILVNVSQIKGTFALVDIGGGSTEISICRGKTVLRSHSFQLGTARLQQVFLKKSPPKSIEPMRQYIRDVLIPKMTSEKWPHVDRVIGSSGTIKALAKIARKAGGGRTLVRGHLSKLIEEMKIMTTTQLLGLPGMEPRRVDMILAGGVLLEECAYAVGAKKILSTDFSLRDGILAEEIELYKQNKSSHMNLHVDDLYAVAARFGQDKTVLKKSVDVAGRLFETLQSIHKLPADWRIFLTAAMILKDTGTAISSRSAEQHSHYIINYADIPAMEPWESQFIAELCLRHQDSRVARNELPFGSDRKKSQAFLKLLALLQVASAFGSVRIKSVRTGRKSVYVGLSKKNATDLDLLKAEQRKQFFEMTFKRRLFVKLA